MEISERVLALAKDSEARFQERTAIRQTRLQEANRGNIWQADDPDRVAKRLAHVQAVEKRVQSFAVTELTSSQEAKGVDELVRRLAQERAIGRDDLVTPQFLKLALAASRCVCRITVCGPSGALLGYGTGMLVG